MSRNSGVKTEDTQTMREMTVKEETCNIKIEEVSLSISTKLETTNSVDNSKMKRTRILFSHLPSVKKEALNTFTEIKESIYQDDDLGESSQQVDVMSCECKPIISGPSRDGDPY
jgi:hypothetical protein